MATDPMQAAQLRSVDILASRLRRRQVVGSRVSAIETILVLRQVLSKARFNSFDQLIAIIRAVGKRLLEAQPKEHAVGNVVRKVLHNIREEYHTAWRTASTETKPQSFSIAQFVLTGQPKTAMPVKSKAPEASPQDPTRDLDPDDPDAFAKALKPVIMEAIQDVFDELDGVYDNVSKNAKDHIHSEEIILTLGPSKTIEAFLKAAAHHGRSFTLFYVQTSEADCIPDLPSSIQVYLIPFSSLYALISRVNTLLLPAHSIFTNGALFAPSGALIAATAARAHRVPVVVCSGQFKLTPLSNLDRQYSSVDFGDPHEVLGFDEGDLVDKVDVVNPHYDYIKPELVDVFVTNDGDHPPASIYRLIKESYDAEDNVL